MGLWNKQILARYTSTYSRDSDGKAQIRTLSEKELSLDIGNAATKDSASNIEVEDTQNNEIPALNVDLERALWNELGYLVSVTQLRNAVPIDSTHLLSTRTIYDASQISRYADCHGELA